MKHLILLALFTALLAAQAAAPEVEITAEPHHHLSFENKSVRVFNVQVDPNTETLMHWHRHDYFSVTLGAIEITNAVKDKPPITAKLPDGDVRFVPATFAHFVRDLSDHPFRNVTIEILEDESLRNATANWDPAKNKNEDRGLTVLPNGTQQILFVKDGIRVTEFELQPGGAAPGGSHVHPMLLVALTDSDLFTADPRTHDSHAPIPPPTHFKTGESAWLALGFREPVVNASHDTAKFVTLEFP
ncbi:MAG: hypothetical protein ACYDDS_20770 [Candidatus Sulfotelmatobacter sp.]